MLKTEQRDDILVVTFDSNKKTNPFSKQLTNEVISLLKKAEESENIFGVVLSGGINRSFSAGGDFKEVSKLNNAQDVYDWISNVMDLYITTLQLNKPCIAAIDEYAIGIGFQLALMCDIRVGTYDSVFIMPELKGGIACTIGAYLLEKFLSRARMQEVIFSSDPIDAEKALQWSLLNTISHKDQLIEEAVIWAKKLASYPILSFRQTKKVINKELIYSLQNITPATIMAHTISIEGESGQVYYNKILNRIN